MQVKGSKRGYLESPREIKRNYPSASFLEDNRVVFNIKGNNYRLAAGFKFYYGIVWIRFVGIHSQYDKIDASKN
jgi:mRNA interferase HigB